MAIIALTLLIPLLGLAILLLDSQRQVALPFGHRVHWTRALQIAGGLSLVTGLILIGVSLLILTNGVTLSSIAQCTLLVGLGAVTALTGLQTFRVPQSWPAADVDSNAPDIIEKLMPWSLLQEVQACHLRSGAWAMLAYPLLYVLPILGVLGAFLLAIVVIVMSAILQSRRSFQSQLLWLITIAVRNKLPLADELRSLGAGQGHKRKHALQQAAQDLDHGDALWMALERNRLLPDSAIAAIRASEGEGRLEETLRRLSIQSTERVKTFSLSHVSEIAFQLICILSAWVLIVGFVMYFIIPKILMIFKDFDVELPLATRVLINQSDYLYDSSVPSLFWMGIGIAILFWQALRHIVGWSSLSFPVLMHWFPKRDAPEVLRTLGGLVGEQASLPQKILQVSPRRGRPDLAARYLRIADHVSNGHTLSDSLYAEELLTPRQRDAIAAAERGDQLPFTLTSLAEAIELREFRQAAYWTELLKPAVIVVCGLVTGFIVIALFLPLVKLLNELS